MYQLKDAEVQIIQRGLSDPAYLDTFCRYFYGREDGSFFRFDNNFTPEGAWQRKLVFAQQTLIVGVMGIGSGKTLGVGMAAYTWAMSTEGFKFMNGCNWAYQSKLMKELVEMQLVDTPAYNFIDNSVDTPYPKITLGFRVGRSTVRSSLEFMSMDKQAAKIFSWRGDWINLDEAALIDQLDVALTNLSTRLTGRTARGREYLGRMSLMTNPWDNESSTHVYYFYDLAVDNPEECLSISIPTTANKNVTERQVKNAMRFIVDPEEQARLLEGRRPEGKGRYFAKPKVNQCADPYLSDYIRLKTQSGEKGYQWVSAPTLGAVEYQMPRSSDYTFLIGDPGAGTFPARNAPVLMAVDAEGLGEGKPAIVRAFWWGNGGHTIQPFIEKMYEYKEKYRPMFVGVDSTGPQAGMVTILNLHSWWDASTADARAILRGGLLPGEVPITGLDFSIGRKMNMLISLRNMLELGLLRWADQAKGIKMQLYHYDPLLDRGGEPKIAQDIVATLAMAAFVLRAYYPTILAGEDEDGEHTAEVGRMVLRNLRVPAGQRAVRTPGPDAPEEWDA